MCKGENVEILTNRIGWTTALFVVLSICLCVTLTWKIKSLFMIDSTLKVPLLSENFNLIVYMV